MDLAETKRIQLATRYFQALQGLRNLVPWGLALVGCGILDMIPAKPWRSPWGIAADLLMVFLACALFWALLLGWILAFFYYRKNFGDVEDRPWRPFQASTRAIVGFTLLGGACLLLLMVLQALYGVSTSAVLSGGYLIFFWLATGRRLAWVNHLLLGVLLLGFVVPAAAGLFGPSIRIGKGIPEIVSGLALIVAGLLDHQRLVRAMRPPGAPPWEGDTASLLEARR